jgi:FAD/FMN-containing dehydrogenase
MKRGLKRHFVTSSIATAGGVLLGTGRAEALVNETPMNIDALKKTCTGVVAAAGDANFTDLLHATLWNRLIPDRAPQVIVRVNDEQDIIAAILFARANKLKVVVRGGGHTWCQPTLRNGGMLIDLRSSRSIQRLARPYYSRLSAIGMCNKLSTPSAWRISAGIAHR